MHWGNFAMFASFFRIGTITSSTRAQKCSSEFGWMSPHVMWFNSSLLSSGSGSVSLLTKNTPLFLKPTRWLNVSIWILGWFYLRGLGQSVCIWSWPPMFWDIMRTWGRSEINQSINNWKLKLNFLSHLCQQSFLQERMLSNKYQLNIQQLFRSLSKV